MSATPEWLQAAILGIIQGLAEFLPISSSAHLVILPEMAGWTYFGKSFDVALHFGTLAAILVYFRQDVRNLLVATLELFQQRSFGGPKERPARVTAFNLILATIPAAVGGFLFEEVVEHRFGALHWVGSMLIVWAGVLWWADQNPKTRELWSLKWWEAALIGLAQMMALMPGTSRSGATIACALFLGLSRTEAARFSFLMSLPIVAGASGYKAIKMLHDPSTVEILGPLLIGMVTSAISGWLCIHFFLAFLRKQSFTPFVVYRILLGLFLFWFAVSGM